MNHTSASEKNVPGAGFAPDSPVGSPPGVSPQDRQLVRACLESAPGAWDDFVGRYAGLLAHVVDRSSAQRQRPLSPADRDDLIAEILIELLKNDAAVLRGFAGRSSLPTYLTVIARRVVVRALCRELEATRRVQPGHDIQPVDRRNDEADLVDREAIEVLLGRLDEAEARLVRLHHLESRSYGEISRITGLPIGSIGPALSKARQKMREPVAGGLAMS
jgi:RNA polymerase sigma-70 factor (ECF subfamily)